MGTRRKVLFVSTMAGTPWGGSEELWTQTALRLAAQGVSVAASIHGWPKPDQRILNLANRGVTVRPRPQKPTLVAAAARYVFGKSSIVFDIENSFGNFSPDLVVISDGGPLPPIDLVELCIRKNWPFVTLSHANVETFWPSDEVGARYRKALPLARRCFFVSRANWSLLETQLGYCVDNAEVVRNPVAIDVGAPIPWPGQTLNGELRLACVGRLHPPQKGQDILMHVLALRKWADRRWRLTLYGDGPQRDALQRLSDRLNLSERVVLAGHRPVIQIWAENHMLVMPSRYEGLPLTIVEAMLCGRPALATNVAGNSEVIEDGVTGFLADAPFVDSFDCALDRVWAQRDKLEEIGTAAAASVRKFLPDDPIGIFAGKITALM